MNQVWVGSLALPSGKFVKDISLSSHVSFPRSATLNFLSVVDISQIPLYLTAGSPLEVSTSCPETEDWFCSLLINTAQYHGEGESTPWWKSFVAQSHVGILAHVEYTESRVQTATSNITEILFYSEVNQGIPLTLPVDSSSNGIRLTPIIARGSTLVVKALPLSSDLLYDATQTSQPGQENINNSDSAPTSIDFQFLPQNLTPFQRAEELKKRKVVDTVFDQATEQRRQVKGKGGERIAAAASRHDNLISLSHKRKASLDIRPGSAGGSSPTNDVFRNRSPTLASESRPSSRRGLTDGLPKHSSLSRVTSIISPEQSDIEEQNRELISRLLLAAMRMYGFQQRKKAKRPRSASAVGQDAKAEAEQETRDTASDEEYKLVYYQTFKGTTFAFRRSIATQSFASDVETIRNTMDKFLAIFATDPVLPAASGDRSGMDIASGDTFDSPGAVQARADPFNQFASSQQSQRSELGTVNTLQGRRLQKEAG